MKSATSDRQSTRLLERAWLLIQTFWVGGLWLLYFVVFPVLSKTGLALLLVEEFRAAISPLMVGIVSCCVVLQALLLMMAGCRDWRGDLRWRLLACCLALSLTYLAMCQWLPGAGWWLLFTYLLLSFVGALLILQPAPPRAARIEAQA